MLLAGLGPWLTTLMAAVGVLIDVGAAEEIAAAMAAFSGGVVANVVAKLLVVTPSAKPSVGEKEPVSAVRTAWLVCAAGLGTSRSAAVAIAAAADKLAGAVAVIGCGATA